MKKWFYKQRYVGVLLLVVLVAELVVQPFGNFPLNDDWAYAKALVNSLQGGTFTIGDCPAMTLLTHLIWGFIFTKVNGFSFEILRLSTLIASFGGMMLMFTIAQRITSNSILAMLAALVLFFTPMYFNLSNTYMTDITFNTLMLAGLYCAYNFFHNKKEGWFWLVYVISLALVFTRQFGIVLPITFLCMSLFLKHRKWYFVISSGIACVCILLLLKYYESYLHTVLAPSASYKFSGEINPLLGVFWEQLLKNIHDRYATVILQSLFFALPFVLFFLVPLFKKSKSVVIVVGLCMSLILSFYIFNKQAFPMGNVFSNTHLGTDTFYESLSTESRNPIPHTNSIPFNTAAHWVMLFGMALILFTLILIVNQKRQSGTSEAKASLFFYFLLVLAISYMSMIFITGSYFDRYHIPLISLTILLFSYVAIVVQPMYMPGLFVLIVSIYISVAGTKDYFVVQNKKWEAYYFLKDSMHVKGEQINGGYEICGWNDGKPSAWYQFLFLKQYKYLIQYSPEPQFRVYRAYEFTRYFPYKKDKMNIFVADSSKIYD